MVKGRTGARAALAKPRKTVLPATIMAFAQA